jgi:uncharacterized RDD family membrane protein YckC
MSIEDRDRATPVGFEDRVAIATPEGVEVELTLAGIGSRFIAGAIDWAIQIVTLVAIGLILRTAGDVGAAVFAVVFFAVIFFYDVLFEVLGGGRTPGKRWTGLRVVRAGGRPITFVRSALRNILRLVDILPGFYAIGMTAIFITPYNQRLGDLAAGTNVVRDRHGDRRRGSAPAALEPMDPGPAASWDVSAVSADDVATVRAFLERRESLAPEARNRIAADLADRLRPRVGGADERSNETFLALLVAAKAARGSSASAR